MNDTFLLLNSSLSSNESVPHNATSLITDTDRHIIWAGIAVFNVIGLFGNLNVIYAHYRLKGLRTKYGMLLTMLVCAQTVCLVYKVLGIGYEASGLRITRRSCYYFVSPYIMFYCVQVGLMGAISTDLLISVAFPLKHKIFRSRPYLAVLNLPGIVFGAIILVLGFFATNDEEVKLCNGATATSYGTTRIWHHIGLVYLIWTVFSYVFAFMFIYCKIRGRKFNTQNIERKALKSLSIIIAVFTIERIYFIFLVDILLFLGYEKPQIERVQAYMVFSVLIIYSSTFYVCFARSSEYRRIYWRQIAGMLGCCGVKLNEDLFGTSTSEDAKKKSSRKFQNESVKSNTSNISAI